MLDNAFGLAEGGDFKIAGVRAGDTGDVAPRGPGRARWRWSRPQVTEPGFADLRADARCEVRPQSFIGEYFIDCQPGHVARGGCRTEAASRSSRRARRSALDLVNNILRRPYRDRLRLIVGELGAGLAGRPEDLNDVIRRAHPGLRETSETLRILGRQTQTIESLHRRRRPRDRRSWRRASATSARFVREAGRTAEISSTRRDELAETFRRLPAFLGELRALHGAARRPGRRPSSRCCATSGPPPASWTRS